MRYPESGDDVPDKLDGRKGVELLDGLASIHLVNLSTATNRCVNPPWPVLNGPTVSNPHTANGQTRGIVFNADVGLWDLFE